MTREEAIKILTNHTQYKCNGEDLVALDMAIKALEKEQKMGQWIYKNEEDTYRCSLCNFPCHKDNMGAIPTKYCAECGAIMREVEE